jgi:hypothetical protein
MNTFKLIGIFGILLVCLQNVNARASTRTSDSDNSNNVVINVGLYGTYNDCISKTNNLYEYKTSTNLKCNCIQSNDCYNKLIESATFKSYFFNYSNITLYLYELNFNDQCYKLPLSSGTPDLYVYNEMDFSQFCGGLIIVSSLLIICIITITILSINYCITKNNTKKKNRNKLLLNSQPTYKALV